MIDLNYMRNHPQEFIERIRTKNPEFNASLLLSLDETVRSSRQKVEQLRNKRNDLAKAGRDGVTQAIKEESKQLGIELKKQEDTLVHDEQQLKDLLAQCPNLPLPGTPLGDKEANQVVHVYGDKPSFSFEPKHHLELLEQLGWIDFPAGIKITGSNFPVYKDQAAELLSALSRFMISHNKEYGYSYVLPPVIVNETSLYVSGNFPKFKDQVYHIAEDNLYLTPTSEVCLVNMYRDTILSQEQLPIRMTSATNCFRREAGTYGSHERGLIRIHQFEKVELVTLCEPQHAQDEFERMLACAQGILNKLSLHYRVVKLATQDMSFQAAQTYDIEVWLPGQQRFYEVSSVSNCTDFQARRGLIRYAHENNKKQLVYTLNGSSLALPRLMVALFETYQHADGSITLPEFIRSLY